MLSTISSPGKCNDCESLDKILDDIDCILTKYTKDSINNSQYELGKCVNEDKIEKLIRYKGILLRRRFNPYYMWKIPNSDMISRVRTLLN